MHIRQLLKTLHAEFGNEVCHISIPSGEIARNKPVRTLFYSPGFLDVQRIAKLAANDHVTDAAVVGNTERVILHYCKVRQM